MFCTKPVNRIANKKHTCTYCSEPINKGESYNMWKSVDDSWFTNKMHHECADDLNEYGDGEYSPYCNDRPAP